MTLSTVKKPLLYLLAVLLFSSMLPVPTACAAILESLVIADADDRVMVEVEFNFPVRYVRHYPLLEGRQIHIQISPISVDPNELSRLLERESVPAKLNNPAKLLEVVYEGSDAEGQYLTLSFTESRIFEVKQGNDYRSIQVLVSSVETPMSEEIKNGQ